MVKTMVPNRKLQFRRLIHPNTYDVTSWAGTKLGAAYKAGKVWTIAGPNGEVMAGEFPTRAEAGEALFQAHQVRCGVHQADALAPIIAAGGGLGLGFYFEVLKNSDRIVITMGMPDHADFGEFSIQWVGLDGENCPRLEAFDDGWYALASSGLITKMASWPRGMTMQHVVDALTAMGYRPR